MAEIQTPPDTSDAKSLECLKQNRTTFENLVERALSCERRKLWLEAAVNAQVAAEYAWHNHCGLFFSPELEALGRRLSVFVAQTKTTRSKGARRKVLHVLTHAVKTGGHTRLAWRWAQQDQSSEHSFALVRQGRFELPRVFVKMIRQGIQVLRLNRAGSLFDWAAALRACALEADFVVLHTHPSDIVPLLALSHIGVPVIIVNHADHVFWLGSSLAWVVANIRDSGLELSFKRRDVPVERNVIVPIPLQFTERQWTRDRAKQQLGLPKDCVVLLSIASAYKFAAIENLDFLRLTGKVLEQHPNVVVLVVGPTAEGRWVDWMKQFSGRAFAIGPTTDLSMFHQAADIYLDSIAFASLTSALETVLYGVPFVSFCPVVGADVLFTDDPGLDSALFRCANEVEFLGRISRLVDDDDLRDSLGNTLLGALQKSRSESEWQKQVELAYNSAEKLGPPDLEELQGSINDEPEVIDIWLERFLRISQVSKGMGTAWRGHVRLLPFQVRLRTCFDPQIALPYQYLLPERLAVALERHLRPK
jgi:hypothetical protein